MHPKACDSVCSHYTDYHEGFPAGSCTIRGIKHKLTPERKDWLNIVGCASKEEKPCI
jgi:hypothetical protein